MARTAGRGNTVRFSVRVGPEWRRFGEDLKSSRAIMREQVRNAAARIAPQIVTAAKSKAGSYPIRAGGAVSQQARAAESLRVSAAKRSVSLIAGTGGKTGTGVWAAGAEWGSNRSKQFLPPRKTGYFLWPAAKAKESALMAAYEAATSSALSKAFNG